MNSLTAQIEQLTKERAEMVQTAKLQDAWYEGRIYQLQELLRAQTPEPTPPTPTTPEHGTTLDA